MVLETKSEIIGMPMIGYGTWQIPADQAKECVLHALNVGYDHIDCAKNYKNEHKIGEALQEVKDRKSLFITSKLFPTDHEPGRVIPAFNTTLQNLKLDYLDMYLIHHPIRRDENNLPLSSRKEWILETWRQMVKIQESGKARFIGVSNFTTTKLGWLLDENERPANNQVELHPYLPQRKLYQFCKDNRIEISAYAPLGSPGTRLPHVDTTVPGIPRLMEDPLICDIAQNHKATPAQVLLRWGIQRGYPVIVKSLNMVRMVENLGSLGIQLSDQEMEKINAIPTKYRYFHYTSACVPGQTPEEYFDGEYFN